MADVTFTEEDFDDYIIGYQQDNSPVSTEVCAIFSFMLAESIVESGFVQTMDFQKDWGAFPPHEDPTPQELHDHEYANHFLDGPVGSPEWRDFILKHVRKKLPVVKQTIAA